MRCLVRVGETTHTRHDAENVVVSGVDTDLGGVGAFDGGVREDKLESGVVDAREVARSGWLVLFWLEGERVDVDTSVWCACVVLVWLDNIEVRSLALREAVLAVKLELSDDDWVHTPAVEVESSFGENESSGIRDGDTVGVTSVEVWLRVVGVPAIGGSGLLGTGLLEDTINSDESLGRSLTGGWVDLTGDRVLSSKGVDGVWKSIDGISVVEWLSTEELEEWSSTLERGAVVDVSVWLDNPDKLLAWVVEVELDLVRGRTDRLITSELKLFDEVFVWVLGHAAALIGVKEDVVDVERSGNERLSVGGSHLLRVGAVWSKGTDGPEALINWAKVEVDLDFVVLESDEWKGETWVTAIPELEWHVESGLWQGVAWSANLAWGITGAWAIDVGESWVSDVSELSGLTDHGLVATLLLGGEAELVPDVHPVTILAIDALTTNLDFDLSNELLTWEIEPAGENTVTLGVGHLLVDLWKSHLKVSAVGEVTVARDCAGDTATEVGLSVECLFDRFNSEVSVSAVSNLPESDLGVSCEIDVLGAIGDKLH